VNWVTAAQDTGDDVLTLIDDWLKAAVTESRNTSGCAWRQSVTDDEAVLRARSGRATRLNRGWLADGRPADGAFTGMVLAFRWRDHGSVRARPSSAAWSAHRWSGTWPVLTALMLTGGWVRHRGGIGFDVVTDQINARGVGTDPNRKLVVPRVLAGVIMSRS